MPQVPDEAARPDGPFPDLETLLNTSGDASPPMAIPVTDDVELPEYIPLALPVYPLALPVPNARPATPDRVRCPACENLCPAEATYCCECGYYFSTQEGVSSGESPSRGSPALPKEKLFDRFEVTTWLGERLGVERFLARDHTTIPISDVTLYRQVIPKAEAAPPPVEAPPENDNELLPSFDDPAESTSPKTEVIPTGPNWPSISWLKRLLDAMQSPHLPEAVAHFSDDTFEYFVIDRPSGRSLWEAWEDREEDTSQRYGYLLQLAKLLQQLHRYGAILESLSPAEVVIDEQGQARLKDIGELLPLPFPTATPIRGGLYTAPELLAGRGIVDARADLYAFGAMLYSLLLGRELDEKTDFDELGTAKLLSRFPDLHPGFARLMLKTLRAEVDARFPTSGNRLEDETGFLDLIQSLDVLRQTQDRVRLDIASWTSTGMVRSENEDAYAVLHATESQQDGLGEAALVLLCDGMGGYEAGEVAAALTIQTLRNELLQLPPFHVFSGVSPFPGDALSRADQEPVRTGPTFELDSVKSAIRQALKTANYAVFRAARVPGSRRRGMGCTAEVVYLDGRHFVIGHVGDSRTYHLHHGRLVQLTRDQTLVNRLVELGTLSASEAEVHPRRNELQQAIGGQPDVEPALYHGVLEAGDWILVCSDGLTTHLPTRDLEQMLLKEATCAEMAARRLVNLSLILGATDNVTVVAIRVT